MTSVYEVYHAQDDNLPASTLGVPSEDDVTQTREVLVNEMGGPEPEELIAWLMAGECPLDALQECAGWMERMWEEQGLPVVDRVMVSAAGVGQTGAFQATGPEGPMGGSQGPGHPLPAGAGGEGVAGTSPAGGTGASHQGHHSGDFRPRNQQLPLPSNPQPPALPGYVESDVPQAHLPGLIPDRPPLPALLSLYDRAAAPLRRGRGAALSLRLFIESLLSLQWRPADGRLHELRFTIREVAGEWLGWNLKDYRPTGAQKGLALRRAVNEVRGMFVDMPQGGLYYPISPLAISGLKLEDQLAMIVCLPSGSDVGPPVDRAILRQLGKVSGPAYRAYLALCCEWDRVGGHNGRLIRPTRPGVMRSAAGHVVDSQGNVLLGKGDRPLSSPYHSSAVRTGRSEANPARFNYREYSSDRPHRDLLSD